MLAIARALLANPKLLLLDEPSEGLAPRIVEEVGEIVLKLKEMGLSVLLVEQNLSLALGVSDYAYVMHRGEIVYQGATADLAQNDAVQASTSASPARSEPRSEPGERRRVDARD